MRQGAQGWDGPEGRDGREVGGGVRMGTHVHSTYLCLALLTQSGASTTRPSLEKVLCTGS